MFESVPTRTIEFADRNGLTVEVRPALIDLNPLYAAAAAAYVQPVMLAASLPEDHPRALTEERSLRILAKAYAMAVLAGSNDPVLDAYSPDEWEAWLLAPENAIAYEWLRRICAVRLNFVSEEQAAATAMGAEIARQLTEGIG